MYSLTHVCLTSAFLRVYRINKKGKENMVTFLLLIFVQSSAFKVCHGAQELIPFTRFNMILFSEFVLSVVTFRINLK